jgi:hypothetical protein
VIEVLTAQHVRRLPAASIEQTLGKMTKPEFRMTKFKCSDPEQTHAGDSNRINSAKIHGEP